VVVDPARDLPDPMVIGEFGRFARTEVILEFWERPVQSWFHAEIYARSEDLTKELGFSMIQEIDDEPFTWEGPFEPRQQLEVGTIFQIRTPTEAFASTTGTISFSFLPGQRVRVTVQTELQRFEFGGTGYEPAGSLEFSEVLPWYVSCLRVDQQQDPDNFLSVQDVNFESPFCRQYKDWQPPSD
jgi:hypothetical protein